MKGKSDPGHAIGSADYEKNRKVYDAHWSHRWRRQWNYSTQSKLKRFRYLLRRQGLLGRNLRIFDQGFGLGMMLFEFDRSCALAGLELSPMTVEAARVEAMRRGYENPDFRQFDPVAGLPAEWLGAFDVVISSHVLEHIADPRPAIVALVSLLKPGGHACVIVPINEAAGEDPNHFHLFTPDSLRRYFMDAGCEILQTHEEDRLWHVMAPVAYRSARRPNLLLKAASLALNLWAFVPLPGLRLADVGLRPLGFKNRQCLMVCRKPSA